MLVLILMFMFMLMLDVNVNIGNVGNVREVLAGTAGIHSTFPFTVPDLLFDFKCTAIVYKFKPKDMHIQRYSKVFKGIQRYSKIFKDIQRYSKIFKDMHIQVDEHGDMWKQNI